jgi:hypothetical protein
VTTASLVRGYDGGVIRATALPERLAQGVAERVVALVVDSLDLDALLARVDVNALLDRIDVERLLGRVDPAQILDRLDPDTLLARVDIQALLARVDVDALLARTDLAAPIAEAATGTAEGALGLLRRSTMRADESVARWSGRLLGRT